MKKLAALFSLVILWSTCGQAAPMLLKSTPANGSVTDKPPTTFVLEFSERVQLHELLLKRDDAKGWTTVRHLPGNEAAAFTIPTSGLTVGGYSLRWTVFTHDSTALIGTLRFTVSAQQVGSTASLH